MTTYQVNLQQMSYVEGEMQAVTAALGTTLSDLEDGVKANLAHWLQSSASDAYHARQAQWDATCREMQNLLTNAHKAIGHIGEYYSSGEKYGVGLWES